LSKNRRGIVKLKNRRYPLYGCGIRKPELNKTRSKAMIKEIAWYLESGRFSILAEELEASLRNYEEAKKAWHGKDVLEPLREKARALFEEHCVRSGMKESKTSFINIDAEFFNGNTLDEAAMDGFIKNIIKGHCFQKVLWTYMGTTGSLTTISQTEMAKAGLKYGDYLPLEYKNNHQTEKHPEKLSNMGTELFFMYGDGTVSKEYNAEKAKLNFNTLEDKSGINWKAGYDPNGSIKKDGWHGEYDYSGAWVRVEEKDSENRAGGLPGAVTIELVKNGDSAILYDPGMLLISPPVMTYLTEGGEHYGNLSMDKEGTVHRIKETLEKMGIGKIGAVCGIADDKLELLSLYKVLLGETALPELSIADGKSVHDAKEAHMKAASEIVSESYGTALERKLRAAGRYGGDASSVMSAVSTGIAAVPLSPRKTNEALALGLSEEEANVINSIHISPEHEREYDAVLSNLLASWAYYESGLSKAEAACLTGEYLEHGELRESGEPRVITAQTSLGEIISGGREVEKNGIRTFASGIPGVFSEPGAVDFYDAKAKEKYLKSLEKEKILPRGGAVSALAVLETLPAVVGEKKAELNRSLTRALGQYKAVAMSTGIPLKELVETVKMSAGFGENTDSEALKRKIYYEIPAERLIEEAKKENFQKKEVSLEGEAARFVGSVVVGGVQGPALDEVLLTREKLMDSGFSVEEADKALPFLHGVRFTSPNPIIPAPLLETLRGGRVKTAGELRQSVLSALETDGSASYNLSTGEGLRAYFESGRTAGSKVSESDIQELLGESTAPRYAAVPFSAVSKVEPRYKAMGNVVPLTRSVPRGTPERIRSVNTVNDTFSNIVRAASDKQAEYAAPIEFKPMRDASANTRAGVSTVSSGTAETERVLQFPFPGRQARDAGLEQLKKIEANYEKDKAALAREKQPALARSESRNVGHAEGVKKEEEDLQKIAHLRRKDILKELRRRKGV
jgi:hypothetical protein